MFWSAAIVILIYLDLFMVFAITEKVFQSKREVLAQIQFGSY